MEKGFTQTDVFNLVESSKLASINAVANDYAEYLQEYDTEFKKVKSPLEGRFLISLLKKNFNDSMTGNVISEAGFLFTIRAQYEVDYGTKKYYPDFCLTIFDGSSEKAISRIFVEIDGHEFHEKTKDQVRHDKVRERHLLEYCDGIVRFSGSEVYDDSDECARESLEILSKKFAKYLLRRGN